MRRFAALMGAGLMAIAVAGPAGAVADRWAVIGESSAITMSVRALGVTQTGRFGRWTGDIRFDPDAPEDAEVAITVRAASLTMRQAAVTQRAVGPGFLDAERYPTIQFRLRALEPTAPGRYTARADVTVRDRTRPVTFPVTLSVDGGTARMRGGFVLDRADYGIGTQGAMNALVARQVRVDVALATRRAS